MAALEFITTADGSKTIYNPLIGENYHSRHGALQESRHVFLKSGLEFYLKRNSQNHVTILEVGFGTGLNFLLTADYCSANQVHLDYIGIEAYPLPLEMIAATGYSNYITGEVFKNFNDNYQHFLKGTCNLNEYCNLHIDVGKLESFKTFKKFDVLYFDAFASVHQPEMWTAEALYACSQHLHSGGVFVTYAITGHLKRTMKSLGFEVEKAKGAPGKREMLRAIKN